MKTSERALTTAKQRFLLVPFAFAVALLLNPVRADALQPLEAFVASAKQNNPDNRQAAAVASQREAQGDIARAAYLPSLTAQGVYTRNQYAVSFAIAPGQTVTITPQNGLDGYFTLAVPIVNVGAWEQRRAARLTADAAEASRLSTEVSVESSVVQAYYQYLGSEAVLFAAQKSLEVAESNIKRVRDRTDLGTASELDVQRALADVARAQQDVAGAEQSVFVARRGLESVSRLTPERAARENYVDDDLHEEAPLATWLRPTNDDLLAVKAAAIGTGAATASRSAARAGWLPTLAAQGQEHLTNAGGFAGRHQSYTLMATATWRLDFSLAANVAAQNAALRAAQATEDKTRRAADDAIYQAWYQVHSGIEKARAARAQVKAASLAQDLARDRYTNGVATQLEVVQAQRDYFSAAVSQVQADFDLKYARAQLRLTSLRTGDQEKTR